MWSPKYLTALRDEMKGGEWRRHCDMVLGYGKGDLNTSSAIQGDSTW